MRPFVALAFVLAGCSKFPNGAGADAFTRLQFRFRVNGAVDATNAERYEYFVAIKVFRREQSPDYTNDPEGPIPVVASGGNGFVEGQPTHFVRFNPTIPEYYELWRFATRAEAPDPSDDRPINILSYAPVTGAVILGGLNPVGSSETGQFGFDVTTLDLATNRDAEDARNIVAIQFNILTMSKRATSGTGLGDRAIDALGNSQNQGSISFNKFEGVRVDTGRKYYNRDRTDPEEAGDVYNARGGESPALDLVDWSLDVRTD